MVEFPLNHSEYLLGADADRLFADDPGDALQQRGRGQRALVRPVVQRAREQGSRVEAGKAGLLALMTSKKTQEMRKRKQTLQFFIFLTYFGFDRVELVQNLLQALVFVPDLDGNGTNLVTRYSASGAMDD